MHLVLQVPGARSLKDRRHVVKSFRERVRALGSVSIAEVGDVERLQVAELGVSIVGADAVTCHRALDKVRSMANQLPLAVLAEAKDEVLSMGRGGRGVSMLEPTRWLSRTTQSGDSDDE
jgi:uncharacterized protein